MMVGRWPKETAMCQVGSIPVQIATGQNDPEDNFSKKLKSIEYLKCPNILKIIIIIRGVFKHTQKDRIV